MQASIRSKSEQHGKIRRMSIDKPGIITGIQQITGIYSIRFAG